MGLLIGLSRVLEGLAVATLESDQPAERGHHRPQWECRDRSRIVDQRKWPVTISIGKSEEQTGGNQKPNRIGGNSEEPLNPPERCFAPI